ncbi:MAG: hypothetical protein ABSE48_14160 [Verrucomicrobiota bacterium]|jgi:hypothetical protein
MTQPSKKLTGAYFSLCRNSILREVFCFGWKPEAVSGNAKSETIREELYMIKKPSDVCPERKLQFGAAPLAGIVAIIALGDQAFPKF